MKFHTVYTTKQKQYNFSRLLQRQRVKEGGRLHSRLTLEKIISVPNQEWAYSAPREIHLHSTRLEQSKRLRITRFERRPLVERRESSCLLSLYKQRKFLFKSVALSRVVQCLFKGSEWGGGLVFLVYF